MDKYRWRSVPATIPYSPDTRSADIVVNTIITEPAGPPHHLVRLKILRGFHARPNVHGALRGFRPSLTTTHSSIRQIVIESLFPLSLSPPRRPPDGNIVDCLQRLISKQHRPVRVEFTSELISRHEMFYDIHSHRTHRVIMPCYYKDSVSKAIQ